MKVTLANLAAPGRAEEVSLLVDTGATLSWIPRATLEKLGVQAFSRLPFTLADGRRLERDTTAVLMTIDVEEKGRCRWPLESRGRRPSSALPLLKAWDFSLIRSDRSLCRAICLLSKWRKRQRRVRTQAKFFELLAEAVRLEQMGFPLRIVFRRELVCLP